MGERDRETERQRETGKDRERQRERKGDRQRQRDIEREGFQRISYMITEAGKSQDLQGEL